MFTALKAKLYAVGAAVLLALMATIKILTMQKKAAQEDARRAKKHMEERKKIVTAEKAINKEMKEQKVKAVEAIKDGKVPDNIRNRNDF